MSQTYPFKNLVFQGGGAKAYTYHGVLEVLEANGLLDQIERVAGSSAGAILATLVSFRLNVAETIDLYRPRDATDSADGDSERRGRIAEKELNRLVGGISAVNRLLSHYGWRSTGPFLEWLEKMIAIPCDGNGRATFAEFAARGNRELYIVTSNLTTRKVEVFSNTTTPDVAVADAVLMSSLIPIYFESLRFDGKQFGAGDFYADGGILLNYPINLFDDPAYVFDRRWYFGGINWETLGCRTYAPSDSDSPAPAIGHLVGYISTVVESLMETQAIAFQHSAVDRFRTINISNCGVSTADFQIQVDENDARYHAMREEGRRTAQAYLEAYVPPTPPLPPPPDVEEEPTGWDRLQNGLRERLRTLSGEHNEEGTP
jgi:NTE family protein